MPAEQKVHRRRVIELSEQFGADLPCEDAIVDIMRTVTMEGLYIDVNNIEEEFKQLIQDQLPDVNRSDVRTDFSFSTTSSFAKQARQRDGPCLETQESAGWKVIFQGFYK